MKYLDLFAGIGGFTLGIKQAHESICNVDGSEDGGEQEDSSYDERQRFLSKERENASSSKRPTCECSADGIDERPLCIGYSEIDKYAIQIYQKHFPNHKNYGDITKIDATKLPDFDLLVGGFPCQSFSIAGKRRGFNDTRGTLFFEIARILSEKRPKHFLLENVKGLLSHDNGRTFTTIISTLTELGYDLQWQVLNSKNFGVPQNRERVFIVGHLRGTPRPKVFPLTADSQADIVLPTLTARYYGAQANGGYIRSKPEQVNQPTHSNDRVYADTGISPTLNTMQSGRRQPKVLVPEATKKGYAEATVGQAINLSVPNSKTRRGRVSDVAQTLDTGMQQYTLTGDEKIRRLTPLECLRLQGFPDNWFDIDGLSDTQKYKCAGNAVTVNVIQAVMELLLQ